MAAGSWSQKLSDHTFNSKYNIESREEERKGKGDLEVGLDHEL